ncbi:MAG: MFS transporter [Spirochaetales bacterium]|nr:MFS transporter [Spirochaetales bacterium]
MDTWQRRTALFIGSQSLSLFGSSLVQYAISWYITLETQSGSMMTIAIICAMFPTFLISPFAGVWADRFDRKKIIILSDAAIALTTLIAALVFIAGYRPYWILFAALVIRALGAGIQTPAVSALLPSLVPLDKLMRVNGIFGSLQSFIMLISPMASAALLSLASIEAIFFVDVVTAFFAIVILAFFLRVPVPSSPGQKRELSYFHDMKAGFLYVAEHPFIKRFFLFTAAYFFFCAPVSFLTPLQVTRNFGPDVWRLTAIEVAFSVGMIAGGAVIAAWGGFKNRIYTMTFSAFLMGVFTVALGVIPWFVPYCAVMVLFGFIMPALNTPATVVLQEKVEEVFLGRVFGVMTMISTVMMPLGMVIFGPMADRIRIEYLLIGSGIILSLLSLLMGSNTTLVREGLPPVLKDSPATVDLEG